MWNGVIAGAVMICRESGSHATRPWRERDSNPRSLHGGSLLNGPVNLFSGWLDWKGARFADQPGLRLDGDDSAPKAAKGSYPITDVAPDVEDEVALSHKVRVEPIHAPPA
jgi:hypothetical protein